MRERWFSLRAIGLHLALLVWFPGCLVAGWWQVTRALGGNALSYLYSIEWPVLALVGVWVWWSLIHTDPETVGARAQRRMPVPDHPVGARPAASGDASTLTIGTTARDFSAAAPAASGGGSSKPADVAPGNGQTTRDDEAEDPELAAYNEYLAKLAARGRQTWRNR